ncbi:MAG: F0F1 ATP synthase subunit C [Spirochaetes bacterium]|nr:F0F1 ATP synthase subunit C [Spirochaetota bacterium]
MDNSTIIAVVSIISAAACITVGTIIPAIAEGMSVMKAMTAIAQQPDESGSISRTLFIGMAMIEAIAIYCLVISIILIFANPFWNYMIKTAAH